MKCIKILAIVSLYFTSLHGYAKDYSASFFGINSNGTTLNTRSIQFALNYINKEGGGRLIFYVGRYLTGTLHMRSNVTIHLDEGAVLLGSLNPFDYESRSAPFMTALLLADNVENFGITGKGIIDGQGQQVARNFVDVIDKGLIKDQFRSGRPEAETRPMNIYFRSCRNIIIRSIMLKNSSSWNQTYDQCKNLTIDSIKIDNKVFWNEDGIDIVDCDSVSVTNCYIDAADDGICLKSHDPKFFCNNIFIRNNIIRSSANAIKFGTASLGGFKNVRIINNQVYDTYRSAVALEAVDGGFIENIEVDSLQVTNTGNLVLLRVGERWGEKTARMNNITIRNVVVEIPAGKADAGYSYEGPIEDLPRNVSPAIVIAGLPNKKITNVTITNVQIKHPGGGDPMYAKVSLTDLEKIPEYPDHYPEFSMFKELPSWGIYIRHAQDVKISNVILRADKKDYRLAIVTDDLTGGAFTDIKIKQPNGGNSYHFYKSPGVSIDKGLKGTVAK
ncbi:MAG: glycosyl hydrolase family 28 protein [Chitinophagaceae bacterium]